MNYLITFIILLVFPLVSKAQIIDDSILIGQNSFCAYADDGRIIIKINDKIIENDINLKNGSRLSSSGIIISSDGGKSKMQDGECIDDFGVITKVTIPVGNDKPRVEVDSTGTIKH